MRLDLESLTHEELGLFNPAICARLIVEAAAAYSGEDGGLPYALAFLILPLAFHPKSRQRLPRSVQTSFPVWISENQELRIGFGARARSLAPFVKAGVRLAINSDYVVLHGSSLMAQSGKRLKGDSSGRIEELLKAARFLGRWFQRSGSPSTIFALLGVRP